MMNWRQIGATIVLLTITLIIMKFFLADYRFSGADQEFSSVRHLDGEEQSLPVGSQLPVSVSSPVEVDTSDTNGPGNTTGAHFPGPAGKLAPTAPNRTDSDSPHELSPIESTPWHAITQPGPLIPGDSPDQAPVSTRFDPITGLEPPESRETAAAIEAIRPSPSTPAQEHSLIIGIAPEQTRPPLDGSRPHEPSSGIIGPAPEDSDPKN